jgi:hypothetical protein
MSEKEIIGIIYSCDLGWQGELNAYIGDSTTKSSVQLTLNADGGAEIGFYEGQVSDEEFREALEGVRRSKYDSIEDSDDAVPPETAFVDVGVAYSGDALPSIRAFLRDSAPLAIDALRRELEAGVISKVRRSRAHVLSATAVWRKQAFGIDEPLVVDVELACAGPLPVTIRNPLAEIAMRRMLTLSIRRVDVKGEVEAVAIESSHLRMPRGAPTGEEVTLAAGEKLSFTIEKKAYLSPGTYEGHWAYRNGETRLNQHQFVSGTLQLALGPITIRRA